MPEDEQGNKWACSPCIRGHRSTKCQHWDRVMLRVKKPGRPLSTCPHTTNNCTCHTVAVMMVRVMRGSQCYCAPDPQQDSNAASTGPPRQFDHGPSTSTQPHYQHIPPPHDPDSQLCHCGDGCECFACPVHPYNATTTTTLTELGNMWPTDETTNQAGPMLPTPANDFYDLPVAGPSTAPLFTAPPIAAPPIITPPITVPPVHQGYTPAAELWTQDTQQPFDLTPQPNMMNGSAQMPEYMQFPFDFQFCLGRAEICACGPDCACPGCLTHKNSMDHSARLE